MKTTDGRNGTGARGRRGGFTLAEVLIASSTGLAVVAATLSLYLFLSKEGKALRSQVEFNNQARVLQTRFVDLVEGNYCLLVDPDNRGVSLYANETAAAIGQEEWIGYLAGSSVRTSRIVYRPGGKDDEETQSTICEWVGPADDGEPMFRLVTGASVALSAHIGDPPVGAGADETGPGRQGMNVVVIGACRNLKRAL